MAYKFNIKNPNDDGWVNLLQAQYTTILNSNGYFSTFDVESTLDELFDIKVTRTTSNVDPTSVDDSFQVGTIWVNESSDDVFICADNTASTAVWVDISEIVTEEIEDIIGDMVSGNTEINISVTYNDTTGKLDFDVPLATSSSYGVASFNSIDFDITNGDISIADGAINLTHLSTGIDASSIDFNSASVNGASVNDTLTTTSNLWSASNIETKISNAVQGIKWEDSVISMDILSPPAPSATATGDRYIIPPSGSDITGDWVGHDNEIAEWDTSYSPDAWFYTIPSEGISVWVSDLDMQYVWNSIMWIEAGSTVEHNRLLGIQGGAENDYYHITNDDYTNVYGSKTQNYVYASPDGNGGIASFRSLVDADIPLLTSSKISDFDDAVKDTFGVVLNAGAYSGISFVYDDISNSLTGSVDEASTITKGISSFNQADFIVTNGNVSLIISDYDHIQSASSTTWSITHSLSKRLCHVVAVDSSYNLITPTGIVFNDDNSCTLTFSSSVTGYALISK